ncbi:hypothetical protein [Mycobacterium sp. URHB0021]
MVINIAVPELRRYAPDALKMVGIPAGQADDCADLLTWTEAVVGGAVQFVQRNRARLLWTPRPRARVVSETPGEVVVAARAGSLLELGIPIFDFICAEARTHRQRLVRVNSTYGLVFLDYLTARCAHRGVVIDIQIVTGGDQSPESTDPVLDLAVHAVADTAAEPDSTPGLDTPAYRQALAHGIELSDEDFHTITSLFEMLRVPTSERSRSHAG